MSLIQKITFLILICFPAISFAQTNDSTSVGVDSVAVGDTIKTSSVDDAVDEMILADSAEIRDVQIEFVKKKAEQGGDSIYFNLCKITNTTSNSIRGNFKLNVPVGWNLIADPSTGIELSPGETKVFAVRMSIPSDALGGVAYVVDGSVETQDAYYSGVSYVKVPRKTKWDMFVNRNTIYFNEYYDELQFDVHIQNQGNGNELVKLQFNIGKLLEVLELNGDEMYVDVPAYTDTVITYTVKRSNLSEDEVYSYKQVWKESVVAIKATSGTKTAKESIWFKDLENIAYSRRQEKNSPLNLDLSVYNLMSAAAPRMSALGFGQILFNGDHDLEYSLQARNIFYRNYTGSSYFNNPNNYTGRIRYKWDDKVQVDLGEISTFSMYSIRGWGVNGQYNINETDKVHVGYMYGKYFPTWAVLGGYQTKFKGVQLGFNEIYEDNSYFHYKAASTEINGAVSFLKTHQVSASVLGTRAMFDLNQGVGTPNDSTLYGISYRLMYNGIIKKFRLGFSTYNDHFNVTRIRPTHRLQGYARYVIDEKTRINAIANYNQTRIARFVNNPFYNGTYTNVGVYRVTYARTVNPNLMYEVGPSVRLLNRVVVDTAMAITSDFSNYFYGAYSQVRIRLGDRKVLTPRLSIGMTDFRSNLTDSISIRPVLSSNVGVSYTDRNWGLSANYIHGPNFFISEQFFLEDNNTMETVYMRGYYDHNMWGRNVTFRGYLTYYLRMPSDRQNLVGSARFNIKFPQRWSAFIVGNLFLNSLDENENGVVTHRNFSLNAGVRKSFDIPQPRIKYYDLTVVCFNDLNGNGEREENEPLLSNVKVLTSKNKDVPGSEEILFRDQELVTDPEGEMKIIDVPEGGYILKFEPLHNLGNLYNSNGDVQEVLMNEDMTLYVPYVESYKVKGRVIIVRDDYSSKGLINANGIRVSALTMEGEVYSALTDNDGSYLINVPQAGFYKVRVNNIFGEEFEVDKEEYLVQFNGFKSFNVDFTFYEGKRKVNMNGGNFFNFSGANGSVNSSSDGVNNGNSSTSNDGFNSTGQPVNVDGDIMQPASDLRANIEAISVENVKTIIGQIDPDKVKFMVEMGIFADDVPVDVANKMMELGIIPTPIKVDNMTIYATQVVGTHADVKDLHNKILSAGFSQSIIVGSYDGKVISEEKAVEYKNQ